MKYFLLFSLLTQVALADSSCIKNPQEHYLKEFGLPSLTLKASELDLNGDDLKDLKLTSSEQCGAKGCEGIIYLQKEKDCFQNVLFFTGSLRVQKGPGQFKELKLGSKTYKFNPLRQAYE